MLISKKNTLSVGDIAVTRLVTGEELVGKVVAIDANTVTVTKPVLLHGQFDHVNGEVKVGFGPFMLGVEEADHFVVNLSSVLVAPMKAVEGVAKKYIADTSSIVVPTKPSLIV